jgi:hypothetical protein
MQSTTVGWSATLAFVALVACLTPRPAGAEPAADEGLYWVFLRGTERGASIAVSERALARRALRGSSPAWADVPVASAHVDAIRLLGGAPRVTSRWLNAVSVRATPDAIALIAAQPFVRDVRPVARVERAAMDDTDGGIDPGASAFQLAFVNAQVPIAAGLTGAGVRVGFLDTLFDFTHPALAHIVSDSRLIGVMDFTGQSQSNFHGRSVTSVALGADDGDLLGPAHGAEVLAATTEYAPTETHAEEDYFIAGLEWLEANGVDVVNVSLSYQDFDPAGPGPEDYPYSDLDGDTTPFTRAVDHAAALGVLVVVSAGNQGNAFGYVAAPADADSVLTVGAAGPDSSRASFSSHGPTFDGRVKPDVAALGVDVVIASGSGYSVGNGTSFAAPMVSAVAAQVLEANPSLSPMDVIELLRSTASQASAPDTMLGWGIIDAAAAVAAASNEPGPAPGGGLVIAPNVVGSGETIDVSFVASGEPVTLELYDVAGRRMAAFFQNVPFASGTVRTSVTLPRAAPGVYLARLALGGRVIARVLVIHP